MSHQRAAIGPGLPQGLRSADVRAALAVSFAALTIACSCRHVRC